MTDVPPSAAATELPIIPDSTALGQLLTPKKPRCRVIRSLHALMFSLDPDGDEWTHFEWLGALAEWVHKGDRIPPESGADTGADALDPRSARLHLLTRALQCVPPWRQGFAKVTSSLLAHANGVRLFSDVGLPVQPGFFREALERLAWHALPAPPEPQRLAEVLTRLFPTAEDARWLKSAPRDVLRDVVALMHENDEQREVGWRTLRIAMIEAVAVLSARICALGLAQDIRDRLPPVPTRDLPFLKLPRACDTLCIDPDGRGCTASDGALVEARRVMQDCHRAIDDVFQHIDDSGVSVDLVYRLEALTAKLGRLENLLDLLVPSFAPDTTVDIVDFFSSLVLAQLQGRSVRELFRQSAHRLARKVIERTGHSGEHYITETPAEWFKMFASASGGGLITAATAALKFTISGSISLAPFFRGLFLSCDYAGSFVLMQQLGFTLATKQPSMTAAALAHSIEANAGPRGIAATSMRRIDLLVDMMARITRSQFAAAVGNVGTVVPVALGFDALWHLATRHHFLNATQAEHVVESLHPVASGTIPYAALTGVFLWIGSVAAGWLENWAVYNRLPEAIAHSPRVWRMVGRERAAKLGEAFERGICGFGGNVSLGFMLGMAPTAGAFFGLPIDVRHVTLSTGALTLSGAALGRTAVLHSTFLWASVGVLLIGLLNFGVSFVLALAVALRAREVRRADFELLVSTVFSRLAKNPRDFILPRAGSKRPSGQPVPFIPASTLAPGAVARDSQDRRHHSGR